eukprot:TRINITY_DN3328_c0_g1_i2.p1 TRINITY_DN3328_c0_g1~~TRINITY_DN3328_c0_g1_i2.p1  ORF type:complete len:289 (+),score=38.47 TRINITY_DN3328_c0_g1_i2:87-953(+)
MASRCGRISARVIVALCLFWLGPAVRKEQSSESEDLETVEDEIALVNRSTGRTCDPSRVNRRRTIHSDMCKCRRRRGTFELAQGWRCDGEGVAENSNRIVEAGGGGSHHGGGGGGGGGHHPVITSDCKTRLGVYHKNNAACIIVNNSKALLVYVYYDKPGGRHKGWDLPGGELKGHTEVACESAEREACEETRHRVRATRQLTQWVYRCEIVEANTSRCQKPVDEGFLKQKWVSVHELDSISYRGKTWGDKKGLLRAALTGGHYFGGGGGGGGFLQAILNFFKKLFGR